jgi:putative solute:sodium symporter small subunit
MTERVTVTGPRIRAPRRPAVEGTEISPVQVRALMRAQARLALVTCAIVVLVLAGLPLLFACAPGLSHVRLLGVRLPWLILCGGVQPVWVALASRYVRLAERAERAFTEPARRG